MELCPEPHRRFDINRRIDRGSLFEEAEDYAI